MEYRSGGVRLFYSVMGEGPAVVLLHPTPCDHRFWLGAAEALAGKYRVILPDLRGHGQSEAGEGPITIEELGADVVRLLDELKVQKALFAWRAEGGPEIVDDTVVTIEFFEAGDAGEKTQVTLTHQNFQSAEMRDRHEKGWTGCLEELEKEISA